MNTAKFLVFGPDDRPYEQESDRDSEKFRKRKT